MKHVRVWNFKMGGVHVSHLEYINVLLFYSVNILDIKCLGFRGTDNNKIYIAIVNEIVSYSYISRRGSVC